MSQSSLGEIVEEATGVSRESLRQKLYDELYGHHGLFSPGRVWPAVDAVLSVGIDSVPPEPPQGSGIHPSASEYAK
ncbi:MAG TPA: hypothetical protein VNP98_17345 [Chthoniobacterales bacterium]|nr:hypothetical protein [Chthoniobacterales bacterium]